MPVRGPMEIISRRGAEAQSEDLYLDLHSAPLRLWARLLCGLTRTARLSCKLPACSVPSRLEARITGDRYWISAAIVALLGFSVIAARADTPATQPSQSDLDFLLSKSSDVATQPTDVPTTEPSSPLQSAVNADARQGTILLSNGEKITGKIAHTQRKPFRIWVEADKEFKDVPFASIQSIDAIVIWEKLEAEWNFKESGSDIKVYSGKTYPARETQYQFTLKKGKTLTGGVVEPLYVATPDGSVTYALHKRDKGDLGQTLDQLTYVKHVEFTDDPPATQP
jgi:hypothetical protein